MPYPDSPRLVGAFGSTRRRKQLAVKESAAVRADAVGGAEAVTALLAAATDSAVAGSATRVRTAACCKKTSQLLETQLSSVSAL